jgi:hypothetical protein
LSKRLEGFVYYFLSVVVVVIVVVLITSINIAA